MLPAMTPSRLSLLVLLIGTLALGACTLQTAADPSQSVDGEADRSDRPAASKRPREPVPATPAPQVGEVPGELMARILDAAAERADVDIDEIEILRAEAVTWPDGSLGCPEPGQSYIQVLIDGYHVVLEAAGEELDYRASENGNFRYCENPGPNRPADD